MVSLIKRIRTSPLPFAVFAIDETETCSVALAKLTVDVPPHMQGMLGHVDNEGMVRSEMFTSVHIRLAVMNMVLRS